MGADDHNMDSQRYSQAASMVYESQMPPQANNKWTFSSKTLMLGKSDGRRRRG